MRRAAGLGAAAVALLAALLSLGALALPASAGAQELKSVPDLDTKPALFQRTGREIAKIAATNEEVREEVADHPGATRDVYTKGTGRWQVSWFAKTKPGEPRVEIAQVLVDDRTGGILEAWTDYKVAWTMARGYDGAFGRKVNAPYVWIPLLIAFLVPFVDWRRPFQLLHLDLLVLGGFSASLAFFNAAEVDVSVPLVFPLLAYLLFRMLAVGLKRAPRPAPRVWISPSYLLIGIVFLVGFRIGLNLTSSNVIDVGYAGVIGADRIGHGEAIYGNFPDDNQHGDTYGPLNYLLYLPFELLFPWTGAWNDLPAAHAAAIVFDLLTMAGLYALGRRAAGHAVGVAVTYAWAAFPFTLFVLNCNANDALVSALLVGTLLVASSAPARGVFAGLAAMAKLAPAALVPLLATHGMEGATLADRARKLVLFALPFTAAVVALLALVVDDLRTFWDVTVAFQADRNAPFSVWGLYDLDLLQKLMQAAAVILAVALAVVPRRHDLAGLAALCAAVLIALQLSVTYWFYLYIVWFFPLVMLALLAPRPLLRRSTA
ncbi:MAG TPA: glycosyltransferase 87 family protein [Solirubrobacteraceae bacterium]|nr:glycosyltransferase 87 family protein [Solirubrobacteraceae bacterium]